MVVPPLNSYGLNRRSHGHWVTPWSMLEGSMSSWGPSRARFWPSNLTEIVEPPSEVWMGRRAVPLREWTVVVAFSSEVMVVVVGRFS